MRSFVVFFALLARTTGGFLQSGPPPVQGGRHPGSCALTAKNTNEKVGNKILNVTGLPTTRRNMFGIAFSGLLTTMLSTTPLGASASSDTPGATRSASAIAYRTISLSVPEFGVNVPVSVWYPVVSSERLPPDVTYNYKISLRRIGQLLAKWEFIPEFISKEFSLTPSASKTNRVVDGTNIPISGGGTAGTKLVFLAHGFLGSRSDLGYIAEDLASQGFICVAPEYPESLEASYPSLDGLDRVAINKRLIPYVKDIVPKPIVSYSAIGHSLGCGTVLQMGDNSWNRVLMGSGRAPDSPNNTRKATTEGDNVYKNPVVGGRLLFISSLNDGPVTSWGGGIRIPDDYTVFEESQLLANGGDVTQSTKLDRVALVFRGEKAPNHISYLSENVNNAMLSFLSPLLPVTDTMDIPVLDFDKYAKSRDSMATGRVLKPLISSFLEGAPEVSVDSKRS